MKPNVINILADVFKLIAADKKSLGKPSVITSRLKKRGFKENEVQNALTWLVSFFYYDEKLYEKIGANRVLAPAEIERLGEEGQEYLTQLTNEGALSHGRREFLLDRIMSIDSSPLTLKQIKLLTFIALSHDKKHIEEIKWIESIVLKEAPEKATLLH